MNKITKIIGAVSICAMVAVGLSSCSVDKSADDKQEAATNSAMAQAQQQIGMPNITNYTERKELKNIYELRDQSNLICYAYIQNAMDGKFIYIGECVGFGIPYGTEYTNPDKVTDKTTSGTGSGNVTVPQADPNLLYPSSDTQATWLTLIDAKTGKQNVMYCEPNTVVYQEKIPANECESWSLPSNY